MKLLPHFLRFVLCPLLFVAICLPRLGAEDKGDFRVLVFSKTAGFRHACIEPGIEALQRLGAEGGFEVDATEESEKFTAENLGRYQVIIFFHTTRTVLDDAQREAFQGFVRDGGGFVGVHAAADTEYDWEWYGQLVGAYFKSHPRIQEAVIHVEDREHSSTRHLPARWTRTDEWYSFRANPRGAVDVLMSLDPDSFEGSEMGEDHPIAWYRKFEGGRAFYTALGHTPESYTEEAFLEHLAGGIRWAAGLEESGK